MASSAHLQPLDEDMPPVQGDLEGHDLVDVVDFTALEARTQVLETGLANINTNLTNLTTLVEQLVRRLPLDTAGGGTMESPPTFVSRPIELGRSAPTQDGAHLFKHMKPPVLKGEDRDRNKDSVMTFLQKWRDVHDLRKADESVKILEASLTLEGRAYKWWMSLDSTTRPTTWEEFEKAFRKEFLPENEKERNWAAWDYCKMEGLTLTQYVSKYRDIILKLDGLDDFQKVRGFLRGLDKEYRTKVKTQNPQTLEAAIKSAQIFDDLSEKRSAAKSTWGSKTSPISFKNGKRKASAPAGESVPTTKQSKGHLTAEEFARAKKEKLCFLSVYLMNTQNKIVHNCKAEIGKRAKGKPRLYIWYRFSLWMPLLSMLLLRLAIVQSLMNVV